MRLKHSKVNYTMPKVLFIYLSVIITLHRN
jgi:hypothetical protein